MEHTKGNPRACDAEGREKERDRDRERESERDNQIGRQIDRPDQTRPDERERGREKHFSRLAFSMSYVLNIYGSRWVSKWSLVNNRIITNLYTYGTPKKKMLRSRAMHQAPLAFPSYITDKTAISHLDHWEMEIWSLYAVRLPGYRCRFHGTKVLTGWGSYLGGDQVTFELSQVAGIVIRNETTVNGCWQHQPSSVVGFQLLSL